MSNQRPPAVLVSVLEFADGTASASRLYEGTPDECDSVAAKIPAVAYNGDKEIDRSYLSIWLREQWDDWCNQEAEIAEGGEG